MKRPGRIDYSIEMKYPTTDNIISCYRWIFSLDDKTREEDNKSPELAKYLNLNKSLYQSISLGLYQQYFVYCYKNELDVIEQLPDLRQMVEDFQKISPDKIFQTMQPSGHKGNGWIIGIG